jgi:hypothetical protein
LTQVKAGATLPLVLGVPDGMYTVTVTLDSHFLTTIPVVDINNALGQISVTIPADTTPGTHQVCANLLSQGSNTQLCMQIPVCTSCKPNLGFLNSDNIASNSGSYVISQQFSLCGDAFTPSTPVSIWFDFDQILATNVAVDQTGRFTATLEFPTNEPQGNHWIEAAGSPTSDKASITVDIVADTPN